MDEERRYLTDDRDLEELHELAVFHGGNGDWYVSVLPKGHKVGPAVRICTSGGAAVARPGLPVAIARLWVALAAANVSPDFAALEQLTERERHVLTYLAEGSTHHEIAKTWGISTKTIDTHRLNLLRKLKLRNNADLTRFAIRVGLVVP